MPSCWPWGLLLCPCGLQILVIGYEIRSAQRPTMATHAPTTPPPDPEHAMPVPLGERRKRPHRMPVRPLTPGQIAWAQSQAEVGAVQADIARVLGVPRYVIQRACVGHCPTGRKPVGAPSYKDLRADYKLAARNLSDEDAAEVAAIPTATGDPKWAHELQLRLCQILQRDTYPWPAETKVRRITVLFGNAINRDVSEAFVSSMIRHEIHERSEAGDDPATIATTLHVEVGAVEATLALPPPRLDCGPSLS